MAKFVPHESQLTHYCGPRLTPNRSLEPTAPAKDRKRSVLPGQYEITKDEMIVLLASRGGGYRFKS